MRATATVERLATTAERDEAARAGDLAAAARDRTAERGDAAANAIIRMAEERQRDDAEFDDDTVGARRTLQASEASLRQQSALARTAAAAERQAAAADQKHAAIELDRAGLDELTGFFRRSTGELALRNEIGRSRRTDQPLVIAMITIDKLTAVNDNQEHPPADALISEVAKAITSSLRSYDVTVRWGGDEFVCSLSGVTLDVAADRIAEIQRALETYHPGATISTGLAQLNDHDTYHSLLARADTGLQPNKTDLDQRPIP